MAAVFLDLDGTLVDSRPGIEASLRAAFEVTGHKGMVDQDLAWMIGPPFTESFRSLGIDNPEAVLSAYRDHYQSTGMFGAAVYSDIPDVLLELGRAGFRLYVATAKPHAYARKITRHFGLDAHFLHEFGPELDGTRADKADLLSYALEMTNESPEASVMIGDRRHDVSAGQAVGMATIAVRWGYGNEAEWAGAHAIAGHPRDLTTILNGARRREGGLRIAEA